MALRLVVSGVPVLMERYVDGAEKGYHVVVDGERVGVVVRNRGRWVGVALRGDARGYENSWSSMSAAARMVVKDAWRAGLPAG